MADPLSVLSAAASVIAVLQLAGSLYSIAQGRSPAEAQIADLVAQLRHLESEISNLPEKEQKRVGKEKSIVKDKLDKVKQFLSSTLRNNNRPSVGRLVQLSIDARELTQCIVDIEFCRGEVRHLETRHGLFVVPTRELSSTRLLTASAATKSTSS